MIEWARRYPGRATLLLVVVAISGLGFIHAYLESPPSFVFLLVLTATAAIAFRLQRPAWRRNYQRFLERMAEREPGTVIIEGALMGGSLLREAKAARAADRPSTIDMDRMPKGSSDDILTVLVAAPSGIKLWRLRAGLRGDPVRFASFDWKDIESIGLGKTPWAFSDTLPLLIARRGGSPVTMWLLSRPLGTAWWNFKASPDAATIARLEDLRRRS